VEDRGYCTRECKDDTVKFRPVNVDNGEANAMVSNVSQGKTVLRYVTSFQSPTNMGECSILYRAIAERSNVALGWSTA
jgi:hypothetical protein